MKQEVSHTQEISLLNGQWGKSDCNSPLQPLDQMSGNKILLIIPGLMFCIVFK